MSDAIATTERVTKPIACIQRLQQAINQHSLDEMADCFDPDYQSQFPAHPERQFHGHETMRRNWNQIFTNVPDIHATLISCVADGETVYSEWEWKGTTLDGKPYLSRGVTIQGVPDNAITWVRMYMEPVIPGVPGATSPFPVRQA